MFSKHSQSHSNLLDFIHHPTDETATSMSTKNQSSLSDNPNTIRIQSKIQKQRNDVPDSTSSHPIINGSRFTMYHSMVASVDSEGR